MVEEPESSPARVTQPNDSTYINYQEEDDYVDETFERQTSTTTADNGEAPAGPATNDYDSYVPTGLPIMCMALYDFQVSIVVIVQVLLLQGSLCKCASGLLEQPGY